MNSIAPFQPRDAGLKWRKIALPAKREERFCAFVELTLNHQHLFKTEIKQWTLHEIEHVKFNITTDSDGDESYSVSLILQSGEELPLDLVKVAGKGSYEEIFDSIKRVLA